MTMMEHPRAANWFWVAAQFMLLIVWAVVVVNTAPFAVSSNGALIMSYSGLGIAVAGLAQVMAAFYALGWNVTPMPNPRKNRALVTTGIFRHVRHPIYGGLLLMIAGTSLARLSFWGLLLVLPLVIFFLLKSSYEEHQLQKKFPEYGRYTTTTKRFVLLLW